uniref:V-type proton ATPase subunit a n=1 Tax=Oreochromis niloticus TaxID=8128 RepID=A0A669BTJ7_ORENI
MGELFRSEEMTLAQLFLQSEAAYCCVSELGELGMVQFRDLNPDVNVFQRKFVNEVRRCEEMDRKLRFVEKEIKKANIPTVDTGENPEVPFPRDMIDLEATFEKLENELKEINTNQEALKKNFLELTELKHILHRTQQFFNEMEDPNLLEESSALMEGSEGGRGAPLRLGFVAGVISRERIPTFERMLWRVCRGNVFLRKAEIEDPLEDPTTGDQVHKSVFIIFFQGDQLKNRVKKICEGFRASLYPCPETPQERKEMLAGVNSRIDDLQMVLNQTEDHRQRVLQAASKTMRVWFIKVRKMKAIYHTLNLCNIDVTQKCLIAEVWCPVSDLDSIQFALRRGTERSGSTVPSILNRMQTKQTPPTFNKTNKFTSGFQNIVDAYGIGSYREINPGHWFMLKLLFTKTCDCDCSECEALLHAAVLWFSVQAKLIESSYFSVFCVIYNDCFSKSLNMFGSGWSVRPMFGPKGANWTSETLDGNPVLQLDPAVPGVFGGPYPLGIDPIWNIATNKLTFLNSFKMKMSVILGVIHMIFGVSLSLFNHLYFKKPLNIFLGFIPEIVFMASLFGYLVLLIFYKWTAYNAQTSKDAPSLLIHFINMCLFNYGDPTNKRLYEGQMAIQVLLVLIALACVPCMLIVKTMVLRRQHLWKKHLGTQKFGGVRVGNGPTEDEAGIMDHDQLSQHSEEGDEFNFGDVAVHQAIHTIEYCLGCISNTASYLRLWALSLAHAQLSEVLWSMVMHLGLSSRSGGGFFGLSIIFAFFAMLTVAILLVMEGLSAFLHALRLHWVEFQNKFYSGQGFKFVPFSFESILEGRFDE